MKKLNNTFIAYKGDDFDASALYLFELQWAKEDPNATGDMPRSKQFGYLFTGAAKQGGDAAIYRTIAHELGHGSFSLKHTFDSQYDIVQNSTQNLMDYSAGTDLVKHQWDAIHDPGLVIGMFERDEDGMSCLDIENEIEKGNDAVTISLKKKFIWGKFQGETDPFVTKYGGITQDEISKNADAIGKANILILKSFNKKQVQSFYENGPLGVRAVLSNDDDIENRVISNFYSGNGTPLIFDENTIISKKLANNPTFKDYLNKYIQVMSSFIKNGRISMVNSQDIEMQFGGRKKSLPDFSVKSEIVNYDYYGLMGGTQTIVDEIVLYQITKYHGKPVNLFYLVSKIHIGDYYGSDWDDINGVKSYLKGNIYSLNAFFWLQHFYGCHPFKTEVVFISKNIIR